MQSIPLMEAELEREGLDQADARRFGGGMKSLALRWWRNEWKRRPRVPEFEVDQREDVLLTDEEQAKIREEIAEVRRRKFRSVG